MAGVIGLVGALALGACTPLTERVTLTRTGGQGSDRTGQAVDVSGDGLTMVVGTPYAEVDGKAEAGLVTVYTRTEGDVAWNKTAEFGAKTAYEEAYFGNAVSLSKDGNTLVVGAPGQSAKGASTVFTCTDGDWNEGTILPAVGANNDRIGYSVAISDNAKVIAVGAPSQNVVVANTPYGRAGRLWVYENVAGVWTFRSLVASGAPQADMGFGSAVATSADGSDIIVGAPQYDVYDDVKKAAQSSSGRVEVIRRSGNAWAFSTHLTYAETAKADYFVGSSVALSSDGTTIAIGVPGYDSAVTDAGAVSVYKKVNNGWDRVVTSSSDLYVSAQAGRAVSLSSNGEYLAVGAPGYLSDKGGVLVLKRNATSYEAVNSHFDTTGGAGGLLGKSISISDDARVIAAGAPGLSNFTGAVKMIDRYTKPAEPTNVKVTAADGSALVSWTAPTETGGLSLTYTVIANPGGQSCTTTGTACIVTGLTNGTSYTFRVSAKNAAGTSQGSVPSAAATPTAGTSVSTAIGTVPGAPTDVKVVPGWKRATISWAPPTNNGGQQVFSFRVTASPGGQSCLTFGAQACTIIGLAPRKQHTFSVVATNALGDSAAATSAKVSLQPKVALRGGPTAAKLASWKGLSSGKGVVVSLRLIGKAAKANCKIVDGKVIAKVAKAECKVRVKSKGQVRTINIYTVRR